MKISSLLSSFVSPDEFPDTPQNDNQPGTKTATLSEALVSERTGGHLVVVEVVAHWMEAALRLLLRRVRALRRMEMASWVEQLQMDMKGNQVLGEMGERELVEIVEVGREIH